MNEPYPEIGYTEVQGRAFVDALQFAEWLDARARAPHVPSVIAGTLKAVAGDLRASVKREGAAPPHTGEKP